MLRNETIKGGEKLVGMLDRGSDHEAPAAGINKMALAIASGEPIVGSAYSEEKGVYFGQPVQFSADGSYKTLPMELSFSETELLNKPANACLEAVNKIPGRKADKALAA